MENKTCCCNNSHEQPQSINSSKNPSVKISKSRKTASTAGSALLSILVAFFPKCPLCWAAWMSMFGSIGLARLPYVWWLFPVLLVFLLFHLYLLFKKIPQRGWLPFLISCAGAVVIIAARYGWPDEKWLLITGMSSIIAGSLLNSFSVLTLRFFTRTATTHQSNLQQ